MITMEMILGAAIFISLVSQIVVFILQPKVQKRNEERFLKKVHWAVKDEWDNCTGKKKR